MQKIEKVTSWDGEGNLAKTSFSGHSSAHALPGDDWDNLACWQIIGPRLMVMAGFILLVGKPSIKPLLGVGIACYNLKVRSGLKVVFLVWRRRPGVEVGSPALEDGLEKGGQEQDQGWVF